MNDQNRLIADKFCSLGNFAHQQKPWNENGKTYATDNYCAVEMDGEFGEVKQDRKKYVDIARIFNLEKFSNSIPVPAEMPKVETVVCSSCKGSGKMVECSQCNGGGECECDCGDIHSCKTCKGNGTLAVLKDVKNCEDCEDCEGTGKKSQDYFLVDLGPFMLKAKYLIMAASLPGAKTIKYSDTKHPVLVEFDGGRALFMPMVKE